MRSPRKLNTPRLALEPFSLDDADDLFSIRGDPLAMVYWDWPGDTTVDQTRAVAHIFVEDMKRGTGFYWTVRSRTTGEFVGVADLSERTSDRADLGFMIRRDLWGRGYASEVAAAVVDEAWAAGLTRLTARCHADNTRSTHLLKRLRFLEVSARPVEIRPGVIRQCRFFELPRP